MCSRNSHDKAPHAGSATVGSLLQLLLLLWLRLLHWQLLLLWTVGYAPGKRGTPLAPLGMESSIRSGALLLLLLWFLLRCTLRLLLLGV